MSKIFILFAMLFMHVLDDFVVQVDFLSKYYSNNFIM